MKRVMWTVAFLAALVAAPWVLSAVYMNVSGVVTTGKVVAKREAILMPGGDTSRHIFELTYEYQPRDSQYRETVVQRVDAAFFRRQPVGSTVKVRYSPSALLRSFAGMGLYLEDAAPLSRLHYGPPDRADLVETAALALGFVLAVAAYGARSKALGGAAALLAGICFPQTLLAACAVLVMPLLFWTARRHPGKGYGLALLATMGLCAAVVCERVPRPAAIPVGQLRTGTATVRRVRVVDEIWSDSSKTGSGGNGQKISPRYQMAELQFTPDGAKEPVHALDRIDVGSLPGLREGQVVAIEFSSSDPGTVRIAGARRNYARQLVNHLLLFTYGLGALVTFVVVPLRRGMLKLSRSSRTLRVFTDPGVAIERMTRASRSAQLAEGDPRRKAIESAVAALRTARKTPGEQK